MDYPVLYKKMSNARLRVWWIDVFFHTSTGVNLRSDWSKFNENRHVIEYIKHYGLEGGKIADVANIVTAGRANRTKREQANLTILGLYKTKEKQGYVRNKSDVNRFVFKPQLLKQYSKYNSASNEVDYINIDFTLNYVAQPKIDGERVIASLVDGELKLYGRRKSKFTGLSHLIREYKLLGITEGVFFDGELTIAGEDISQLISVLHKHGDTSEKNRIIVKLFDFYDHKHPNLTYRERYAHMEYLINENNFRYIKLLPYTPISSHRELDVMHKRLVKQGHEGVVIRNLDSVYQMDKRTKGLIKWKYYLETDYVIIGFTTPVSGRDKGTVMWLCAKHNLVFNPRIHTIIKRKITTGKYKGGYEWIIPEYTREIFIVKPTGSIANRKKMFTIISKSPKIVIGKKIQVWYQTYTEKNGVPKFAFTGQLIPKAQ